MGAELSNIPALEGWVNLTEAAEMLGISRQHAFKKARQANDGHPSGWKTIRRVGSKPMYVISAAEIADIQSRSQGTTDLAKGTLSAEDRTVWLRSHRMESEDWTDEDILMAIGSGMS